MPASLQKKMKDPSELSQMQSNWQMELKSGWGLCVRPEFCGCSSPSLYMLKGEVNPEVALLVLLTPAFFTHSLPHPSTQSVLNIHPDSLYVHTQTVSQITAHSVCAHCPGENPLPSINDALVSSPDWNRAESMLWEALGRAAWPFLDTLWWAWGSIPSRGRGLTIWAGWVHWLKLEQQWKSHLD